MWKTGRTVSLKSEHLFRQHIVKDWLWSFYWKYLAVKPSHEKASSQMLLTIINKFLIWWSCNLYIISFYKPYMKLKFLPVKFANFIFMKGEDKQSFRLTTCLVFILHSCMLISILGSVIDI